MQLWIYGGKIVQLHEVFNRRNTKNARQVGKGVEIPSADGDTTDTDGDDELRCTCFGSMGQLV